VKSVDIGRNTESEGISWGDPDAEGRKRGDRTGLDTPVFHALNDGHWLLEVSTLQVAKLTR